MSKLCLKEIDNSKTKLVNIVGIQILSTGFLCNFSYLNILLVALRAVANDCVPLPSMRIDELSHLLPAATQSPGVEILNQLGDTVGL